MGKHVKKQVSLRLSNEGLARLDRLSEQYVSKTDAVEAALSMADGSQVITREQLLAELERRLQ